MVKIIFGNQHSNMLHKILHKQPGLKTMIDASVNRFKKNPNDSRLENHKLKKRLSGKLAFSVNGDIRIVYEWIGKNTARFLAIGGHAKVYSKRTKSCRSTQQR